MDQFACIPYPSEKGGRITKDTYIRAETGTPRLPGKAVGPLKPTSSTGVCRSAGANGPPEGGPTLRSGRRGR